MGSLLPDSDPLSLLLSECGEYDCPERGLCFPFPLEFGDDTSVEGDGKRRSERQRTRKLTFSVSSTLPRKRPIVRKRKGVNAVDWSAEEDAYLVDQVETHMLENGRVRWRCLPLPTGRSPEMARHRWARIKTTKLGRYKCTLCLQPRLGHTCPFKITCSL